MNNFGQLIVAGAVALGSAAPALAQTPPAHQHGQPAAQSAPAPEPGKKGDCDCCQMMKEMMQMMHNMHGQGMKPGGMMQGPDVKQPAPPEHEKGSQ